MADTNVDWADKVWNPSVGCDWASRGCDYCYAMTMAPRLQAMELGLIAKGKLDPARAKYQNDGDPATSAKGFGYSEHEFALDAPLHYRKGYKWFVNSMGDVFHRKARPEFIAKIFAVMAVTPQHTYQLPTKRAGRMRRLLRSDAFWRMVGRAIDQLAVSDEAKAAGREVLGCLPNLWLAVSVEDQDAAERQIKHLVATPAAVRWVSCEPLLGPLDLSKWIEHLDWLVVGGESGSQRRMDLAWALDILRQARGAGVPYYFKQAGTVLAGEWGIRGKGNNPDDWPEEFPREFPEVQAA
jgi:protein gp37